LYSFSRDEKEHAEFYEKAKQAYVRIFDRVGLGAETFVTFASGGSFSKYSHEFQALTEAGEDLIYIHEEKKVAVNKEVLNDEVLADLGVKREDLVEKKAVEVGNIFSLGTKFSEPLGLVYSNEVGKPVPVVMGSYGIGPGRVMGTIVEVHADEKGLVWPKAVAPFDVHLVALFDKSSSDGKIGLVRKAANDLYKRLTDKGVEVLFDDRETTAGEKFGDSDLIGIPVRYVISEKTLAKGEIEVKDRLTGNVEMVKIIEI